MSGTRVTLIAVAAPKSAAGALFGVDRPPSAPGLAKMAAAAPRFAGADQVVRSPAQSAARTGEALDFPDSHVEPALRDRGYGLWSGRTLIDIAARESDGLARLLQEPDAAAPGGESLSEVVQRMAAWLRSVAGRPGHLVAITHPPVVSACVVAAMEGPAALCFRLDVGHGSRSVLTSSGAGWRVALMNGAL